MGSNTRRIRERIESGEVAGPKIRSAGEALFPRGALPPDSILAVFGLMKYAVPEISNAAEAAAAAKKLLDEGADGIKIFPQTPNALLTDDVIRAAVHAAHERKKPVFAHAGASPGLLAALRGGVDIIAHTTPFSGPWDEATLALMKQRGVALIPTLKVWKHNARHDRLSSQDETVRTITGQLRAWIASSGTVLFGTDAGYVEDDPTEEYLLMEEAGMSFRQILASLTTAPAERFGEAKESGRIEPGFRADLVVLKDDPSKDIRALARVQCTLRAGKIMYLQTRPDRR
jgi:imidazolonepropionase-like amidohydrolase